MSREDCNSGVVLRDTHGVNPDVRCGCKMLICCSDQVVVLLSQGILQGFGGAYVLHSSLNRKERARWLPGMTSNKQCHFNRHWTHDA